MRTTLSNISEAPGRSNVPECTYKTKNNTMVLLAREKNEAHFRMYLHTRCATRGGGIWGICPLENFKTLPSNFDICETFKNKDEILYFNHF